MFKISYTRPYHIWKYIKQRCYNKNHKEYKSYGGKGIGMCEEWINNPVEFYNWSMSNGYADNLSIDRIDNSKGYSPDNCRWVTFRENHQHHMNNIVVEHNGAVYCSFREFTRNIGIPNSTVRYWVKTNKLYEKCGARIINQF